MIVQAIDGREWLNYHHGLLQETRKECRDKNNMAEWYIRVWENLRRMREREVENEKSVNGKFHGLGDISLEL
jgi:hypothetical protein